MTPFRAKSLVSSTLAVVFALTLLAGCSGQSVSGDKAGSTMPAPVPAPQSSAPAPKKVIKFADSQFQTLWINNAIAGFLIEKGYGYPVETVEVTTPIMQQSLAKGDIDVMMELWHTNIIDWYTEATTSGKILDLGDTYEKSGQGWYVPRYIVEGDSKRGIQAVAPDLKSVSDLPKYKHVFADPENPNKGLLINCITGWQCAKINRIKLQAYGLSGAFNVQEPGAAAALDAAIAGAYKKGKPFLAYYWEPTWLVGTYDLIQLKEPAYTKECNEEIQKALTDKVSIANVGKQAGCAYESMGVHKGVHSSLKQRAPEVVEFLQKMNVGTDALNRTAAYMEAEKVKADKAALWFFEHYQDKWRRWMPADVRQKVEQALKEAGAKL